MELRKRGNVWWCDFIVIGSDGRSIRKQLSTRVKIGSESQPREYKRSRDAALEAAAALQRHAQLKASGLAAPQTKGKPLSAAYIALLEDMEQIQNLSQSSLDILEQRAVPVAKYFGTRRDIATITKDDLKEYAREALRTRAPGTVARELRHLREAIKLAGFEPPEKPDLGKEYTPREHYYEPEEFWALLAAMDAYNERSGRVNLQERTDWITINAYTGLTQGRLQKLTPSDVLIEDSGPCLVQVTHAGPTKRWVNVPDGPARQVIERRLAAGLNPLFPPWTSGSCRLMVGTPAN